MLRKNFIQKPSKPANNCSLSTQTDEFLVFLPIQQKLKKLMSQYHNLQTLHEQAMNKNQYLQYKNQLLQSSLMDLTYTFNNTLLGSNIKHLKEIADIQLLIEQQNNSLSVLQNLAVNKCHQQKQRKSSRVDLKERQFQQNADQNQFLHMEKPQILKKNSSLATGLQQKKIRQFDASALKVIPQTHRVIRSQSKCNPTTTKKKKSGINEKENLCVQKMIRIEAEIKLRKFMSEFERGSKANTVDYKELSPNQSTVYYLMHQTNGSQMLQKQASAFTTHSLKSSVR